MFFSFFFLSMSIILLVLFIFFILSKSEKWEYLNFSTFECGYSSYFFSRFSFSIHFFLVALIFLFLDLEICMLMPFMLEYYSNIIFFLLSLGFVIFLFMGLLMEWLESNIEWKN